MSSTPTQRTHDHAQGALFGACIGDAAGAVLEFLGHHPTSSEVEAALQMPGGGVWDVCAGQVTDDGELMLSLAQGLAQGSAPDSIFSIDAIAQMYLHWYASQPFDIGNTTRNALGSLHHPHFSRIAQEQGVGAAIQEAASHYNMGSKANGSLMRCMPLGVWGYALEDHTLADCAFQDAALTHPHPTCQLTTAAYVIAIAHLIRYTGDTEGAFEHVATWLGHQEPDPTLPDIYHEAHQEVMLWLFEASMGQLPAFQPMDGFVRIAWTHAFYHLRQRTPFEEALRIVLSGGGDTDTNACIVGGLLGAAYGLSALPQRMVKAVQESPVHPRHPRPDFLHPRNLPHLTNTLLQAQKTGA